jgi:hypothetical protein
MEAGILAMMEDYIIAIIQYVPLMSGSESKDCYHSAFHRKPQCMSGSKDKQ